jgi:DNA (cytosine-5)-methyltransferase 1
MKTKKLTIGGLCSGVGGIELGFKRAGFNISWANDMDEYAMQTYEALHHTNHYIGKKPNIIKKLLNDKVLRRQLSKVDVLVSGFPCQPFSLAGHRKGFEDERGTIIEDIFEIVKHIRRPKVIFLENVKNFRNHSRGETFTHIRDYLRKELKYSVYDIILNACDYTKIPQNRERTFLVCFKDEPLWEHPDAFNDIDSLKSKAPLTSLFHENLPKKTYKKEPKDFFLNEEINDSDIYSKDHFPEYYKMLEKAYSDSNGNEKTFYQIRRIYARFNANDRCPTLTANMGTGGHNVPIIKQKVNNKNIWRRLTPKECFNLQGFPKNFELPADIPNGQLYKQSGNSVSIPLITKLAKSILLTLNKGH